MRTIAIIKKLIKYKINKEMIICVLIVQLEFIGMQNILKPNDFVFLKSGKVNISSIISFVDLALSFKFTKLFRFIFGKNVKFNIIFN